MTEKSRKQEAADTRARLVWKRECRITGEFVATGGRRHSSKACVEKGVSKSLRNRGKRRPQTLEKGLYGKGSVEMPENSEEQEAADTRERLVWKRECQSPV